VFLYAHRNHDDHYSGYLEHFFSRYFSHFFAILGETANSEVSWVVVQRGRFWHLNHVFSPVWAREAQKRETGSIGSEGDLRCGSGS